MSRDFKYSMSLPHYVVDWSEGCDYCISESYSLKFCIYFECINPYEPNEPNVFLWDITNSVKPDQTPQNAASNQFLYCLQTEVCFNF